MWCLWLAMLSAVCAAAPAPEVGAAPAPEVGATTTRPPIHTLDRKAAEMAWRSWLQSPESGNQNGPPRRITTKSLFNTPLVCPKGHTVHRDACIPEISVSKGEHERILVDSFNLAFPSPPSGDAVYDYGEDQPGPLQLSIPIGLEPQAAPLQSDSLAQLDGIKVDKKEGKPGAAESIEAELELLKLQLQSDNRHNDTDKIVLTHNINHLPFADKPKRDSPILNDTQMAQNYTDEGQKELVFGHVNVDPVLYYQNQQLNYTFVESETNKSVEMKTTDTPDNDITTTEPTIETTTEDEAVTEETTTTSTDIVTKTDIKDKTVLHELKKDVDKTKLNPENDYSDIGEAIKLISRYAEVTTDDNFSKDGTKLLPQDDSILGTRTKLQYRRNKLKSAENPQKNLRKSDSAEIENHEKIPTHSFYPKTEYYRYPWLGQHSPSPPPEYPFRHLQDYWPGRIQYGGVYNTAHENPRRHHHSYPHSSYRPHGGPYPYGYTGLYPIQQQSYVGQHLGLPNRLVSHHADPMRFRNTNQDLYSLFGLRHWFGSEGSAKR